MLFLHNTFLRNVTQKKKKEENDKSTTEIWTLSNLDSNLLFYAYIHMYLFNNCQLYTNQIYMYNISMNEILARILVIKKQFAYSKSD